MKHKGYLILLLLLVASCASRQTATRHRNGYQADIRPELPVNQALPSENPAVEREEEVRSARPLISQVRRANPGSWQAQKQQALDALCQSPLFETTQLGLYVYDLTDGQPLYAVNAAHRMRPASCQKVVTAITALHYLKGNYQLKTDFRTTGRARGRIWDGDLYVVGGMDPLVTNDELFKAAAALKLKLGIDSIAGSIIYDLSMREETPMGWGWCWDDNYGPLSALLVDGKDTFDHDWRQALRQNGIRVSPPSPWDMGNQARKNPPTRGEVSGSLIYTIRHNIDEVLEPMMKHSNNIFAECLFYQVAASTGKKGGGHRLVAERTNELLNRIGVSSNQYQIADGSGLSLYNYVSAEMLVAMLGYAWRTDYIREHLLPSLPVAGIDGTLGRRMQDTRAQGNVRAKTGTVTGISSLAGYITAANNHILAFAIINQGISSSSVGRSFQDKVCEELCR